MSGGRAAILVGLIFVAREVLLLGLTPPLHAPDEQAHFDYVQHLADTGALPRLERDCVWGAGAAFSAELRTVMDALVTPIAFQPKKPLPPLSSARIPEGPEARATDGCSYVAIYPPVYYAVGALADRLVREAPFYRRLAAVRATSILWGLVAVLSAFACGRWLWGRTRDGVLLALAVGLQPTAGFLFASVNSDAAVLACGCLAAACLARLAAGPPRARPLLVLAGCCLVGALSKPTFVLLLPWIGLCAVLASGWRSPASWAKAALALAPAALAYLAWQRHFGELMAFRFGGSAREVPLLQFLGEHVFQAGRLRELWGRQLWLSWGWLDVVLRPGWYVLAAAVELAALVGLAVGGRGLDLRARALAGLAAVTALGFTGSLYAIELSTLRSDGSLLLQGRYLAVGLWPLLALGLLLGLRALGDRLRAPFDAAGLLIALLLVLDVVAALRTVARYCPPEVGRIAHAREVFEAMVPGGFWVAIGLQLAALAGAGWAAIDASARPPGWHGASCIRHKSMKSLQ